MPVYTLFTTATDLFELAVAAYTRTKDAPNDRSIDQRDALVAVVFASATLEAFINEVVDSAAYITRDPAWGASDSVKSLANLGTQVEESRGSIELKYLLASALAAGSIYDKGSQPYQDFALLISLRNWLVHPKPRDVFHYGDDDDEEYGPTLLAVTHPKLLDQLRSRNVIGEARSPTSWLDLVCTRAVARWACNTAAAMIQTLVTAMGRDTRLPALEAYRWIKPVT